MDRAAWATVFADEHMKIQCVLTGPVWAGNPQSSQAAEHLGAAMPAMVADGPYQVLSDSMQAVRQGSPQELARLSPKAMYAGIGKRPSMRGSMKSPASAMSELTAQRRSVLSYRTRN